MSKSDGGGGGDPKSQPQRSSRARRGSGGAFEYTVGFTLHEARDLVTSDVRCQKILS